MRLVQEGGTFHLIDADEAIAVEASKYLDAVRARGLSPRTLRAYAFDLLRIYRWLDATKRRVQELLAADLVDFIRQQQESSSAPRSINRRLTTLRLLFRFLVGRELDQGPGLLRPAVHYKGPGRDHALGLHHLRRRARHARVKVPRLLIEPLSSEQVRSFLRTLSRYRDLAIVHSMLLCGLRSREVLELAVADVVVSDRCLRVRGKGERDRVLPLPEMLARAISNYTRCERPTRADDRHLFVVLQGRRRGQPMTAAGLRSLFRHRRRRAFLAIANAHRFRHTFGTDMARAGVRLPVLQRMMGHADLSTTLQYIELSMADVADEYQRAIASIEGRYQRQRPTR